MVGDGVLDDLDELLVGCGRADLVAVQQLDHETSEALKGTRDAHGGIDLDEHAASSLDVDLQLARLVDGRIKQREQALHNKSVRGVALGEASGSFACSAIYLVGDVGPGLADIAAHLAHNTDVVIAVEQVELVFTTGATATDTV